MTKEQAIEDVGRHEQWEFFEGVVAEPTGAFEDLVEYFDSLTPEDDDYPIAQCDIINRIESCRFEDDYEEAVKLAILGKHQTPQWDE